MPGPYSSAGSLIDAKQLAENLGIQFDIIPINERLQSYLRSLKPVFANRPADVSRRKYPSENPRQFFNGALQ